MDAAPVVIESAIANRLRNIVKPFRGIVIDSIKVVANLNASSLRLNCGEVTML
jgi:hypothetical protein